MRKAKVFVHGVSAAEFRELEGGREFQVEYEGGYAGPPISLVMPTSQKLFTYDRFPPFFEGVLPEGVMLSGLLTRCKINADDYFSQLMEVGADLVGAVTVESIDEGDDRDVE
ncbi:MAG: HipA N-terminal domain-containing protein [Pseudodesulfovibrio sp.]|nr:HipA N-terminal domain-containing protein [Pseudodesulfovibrio sp.]